MQSYLQQAEEYCEKMRDNEESRISHYDIGLFRNIQCIKLRPHLQSHCYREGGGGILSSPFCFSLLGSWNSAVSQIVLLLMLIDHRRSGRQLDAVAAAHLRAFGRWFAMGHC